MLGHHRRAEHHFAVVAAVIPGAFDTDGIKPLFHGAGALVGGQNALVRRHHGLGNVFQSFAHLTLHSFVLRSTFFQGL